MYLSGSANVFCGASCAFVINGVASDPTEANNRIHPCFMVLAFY